jgi:hypothetical protein
LDAANLVGVQYPPGTYPWALNNDPADGPITTVDTTLFDANREFITVTFPALIEITKIRL